jgi:hypothetical protein
MSMRWRIMMELNASLEDDARRQAAYLAVCRYAAVAVVDLPTSGYPPLEPTFRSLLKELAKAEWSIDDVRLRGELESRTYEYLDL